MSKPRGKNPKMKYRKMLQRQTENGSPFVDIGLYHSSATQKSEKFCGGEKSPLVRLAPKFSWSQNLTLTNIHLV